MYYCKNFFWSEESGKFKGLPRPYLKVPEHLLKNNPKTFNSNFKTYLHKIIPVPWQSIPSIDYNVIFSVNVDHEKEVMPKGLCGFCGLDFDGEDDCIIWITQDLKPSNNGPRVFSDSLPHHLECMNQARIFCPFMRTLNDEDFEIGKYKILKKKAEEKINLLLKRKK
jgi:hypothetical protein